MPHIEGVFECHAALEDSRLGDRVVSTWRGKNPAKCESMESVLTLFSTLFCVLAGYRACFPISVLISPDH